MAISVEVRGFSIGIGLAALLTGLSALPAFDGLRRTDTDVLHMLRAATSSSSQPSVSSRVAVVAIDEATYATAPFVGLPKVMWTPQMAAVQDAILDGGAAVFGWDVILPTSAATYLADQRFDASLLKSLSSARKSGKIVLGTAHFGKTRIEPHRLFSWSVGWSS